MHDIINSRRLPETCRKIVKARWAYYFLLPGLAFFFVFSFIPIIQTIKMSFYNFTIVQNDFIGLGNYKYLFTNEKYISAYLNTLKFIVVIVPANVILSVLICAGLANSRPSVQSFFRGAFYLPTVVGGVIISAVWLWMFHPVFGLFNYVLKFFNKEPVLWLADQPYAFFGLCAVVLTWTMGVSIIVILAGMLGISPEYYEAAKIDGANRVQVFFRITIPLLKPVIVFVISTQLISVFQLWEVIYMLTNGGPNQSTSSIVYEMYKTAFVAGKYGLASAQGVLLTLTILIASLIFLKSSKEI